VNGIPVTLAELRVIGYRRHPVNDAEITEIEDVPERACVRIRSTYLYSKP
jgi:hypothetical protein